MTQLESRSQKDDLTRSQEDSQQSTNLNSKKSLIRRLRKSRDARTKFVESHLNKKLAFQIRSLRGDSSQEKVEEMTGIKQQAISRLENPYYGKATLTTLKRIAAAYDVGLLVEFVPFSELVNRVSGTPYTEYGFRPETMNVPSFEEEEKRGALKEEVNRAVAPSNLCALRQDAAPILGIRAFPWQETNKQTVDISTTINVTAPSGAIQPEMLQAAPFGSYTEAASLFPTSGIQAIKSGAVKGRWKRGMGHSRRLGRKTSPERIIYARRTRTSADTVPA
jgi:transcriptional regulator with XRE-family HTH domain